MKRKSRLKLFSGLKILAICLFEGMSEIRRYISRNWIWIVVGLILTEVFVKMAYAEREAVAYGGEWLTLPLVLMAVEVARAVGNTIRYLFEMEDDYEVIETFSVEKEE